MNHIRIEDNPFDIVVKFFLFLSLAELVRGWIVCSRLLDDPDASVPAISEEDRLTPLSGSQKFSPVIGRNLSNFYANAR